MSCGISTAMQRSNFPRVKLNLKLSRGCLRAAPHASKVSCWTYAGFVEGCGLGIFRRLKLLRQLLRRAPGADQLDHLATEFRWVGWSRLRHRGLLEHKCSGVHETGSTSGRPWSVAWYVVALSLVTALSIVIGPETHKSNLAAEYPGDHDNELSAASSRVVSMSQ